jgi:2-phosphosulfolactate phosphatase
VKSSPGSPFRPSHDQHDFRSRLEWGQNGVRILAGQADLVVIVDVLSFSTAVSVAVDHRAVVIPHRFRDDTAEHFARSIGATLANPDRRGSGASLSPASLSVLRPGERLVLPSPNGATCSLVAAESGATVVAGCLRNASAVGRFAAAHGGTTAVIAAGEIWPDGGLRPAIEDLIGAGAVMAVLDPLSLSPEARIAVAAFRAAGSDMLGMLSASSSGRELIEAGFAPDVMIAAELDATDLVPVLRDGAFTDGERRVLA